MIARSFVRPMRYALFVAALMLSGCGASRSTSQATPSAAPSGPATSSTAARPTANTTTPSASPSVQAPAGASSSPATTTETADAAATPGFNAQQVALNVQQVASGFDQPVFVTHAGDGSRRMFVVEKGGVIKLLDGQTFIDISDRVRSSGSEQGLLGLAFHPQFAQNGLFFVNYIDRNGNTVVSRFSTTADKQRGDPASEQVLLRQEQPAANHNGGMVAFGPDGMLYIGLGDGGGANDQFGNGQNLQTWLGTLLRIDVNSGATYAVPPNNPFVKNASARPEIWAYGLRNPWRFSFDRATGDLYIADVGQNQWEEIDAQPANSSGGENYGWSIREGAHCFRGSNCETTGLVDPIAEYEHGLGCSVTGGYVYRGASYPALQGAYIFGDYCTGRIWTAARNASGAWQTTEMLQLEAQISSFGEDEAGELYLTDIGSGSVYQVTAQER